MFLYHLNDFLNPITLFIFTQRTFIEGITLSALKD